MRCTWLVRSFDYLSRMNHYLFFNLDRGVQMSGYMDHQTGKFVYVEDMEPEIIVPDLTDFKVNFLSF